MGERKNIELGLTWVYMNQITCLQYNFVYCQFLPPKHLSQCSLLISQWQNELCLRITIISYFSLERHHESVQSSFSPQSRAYSSSPVTAGTTLNNASHDTGVLISNVYIAFQLEGFRWRYSHLILWCFPYETKAWHILNINQWLKPR